VIWCYPRGGDLPRQGETAIDIKVKPADRASRTAGGQEGLRRARQRYLDAGCAQPPCRTVSLQWKAHCRVLGRRGTDLDGVFDEARAVRPLGEASLACRHGASSARARDDGDNGSIIGRNTFQLPKPEALRMLSKLIAIYYGKD